MPWVLFCAVDMLRPPAHVYEVTEAYQVAQSKYLSYGKQLVRAADTVSLSTFGPHWFQFVDGADAISGEHTRFRSPEQIRVRHYYAKSRQEYVARRQGADSVFHRWRDPVGLGQQWDEYNGHCRQSAQRGLPDVCWRGYCEYTTQRV